MMGPVKLEHVALWTNNLERLQNFYIKYFQAKSNKKYRNKKTGFESYFLSFGSGSRIEIMTKNRKMEEMEYKKKETYTGYSHIAFSVGNRVNVDSLTEMLKKDGFRIINEPRVTGDGYYESIVLDPDGNQIEITG